MKLLLTLILTITAIVADVNAAGGAVDYNDIVSATQKFKAEVVAIGNPLKASGVWGCLPQIDDAQYGHFLRGTSRGYFIDNSPPSGPCPQPYTFLGEIAYCGGGGESAVYKLTSSQFATEPLAMIVNGGSPGFLAVACILSSLGDRGITDYFFRVHAIIKFRYISSGGNPIDFANLVVNYVESDFDRFFLKGFKLPDSVIFELALGEWAGFFYCGIRIGDVKARNFGITSVAHSRCYRVGDKTYLFPAGLIPVREDYSDYGYYANANFCKCVAGFPIVASCAETEVGKAFIAAYDKKDIDMFTLFDRYFGQYKLPVGVAMPDDTKIYTVPTESIESERKKFLSASCLGTTT